MIDRNGSDYVTLTTAADTTNIPASTLRYWIESGQLPAMTSERGRQVRVADVWRLVEVGNLAPRVDRARDGAAPHETDGTQTGEVGRTTAPDEAPAEIPPAVPAPHIALPPARLRQRLMTGSAAAAFMAKIDELYRAQIATKDGEIATKNELIAELRLRAQRAEQQLATLEQQLSERAAPAAQQDVLVPENDASRGLLIRLVSWLRGY